MDPEPNLKNSFKENKRTEPFISFEENNGIKTFKAISMIDESESIVFSQVNFDSDYNFIYGQIKALSLRTDEYKTLKKLNSHLSMQDLIYYTPEYAETYILKITPQNKTFEISLDNNMIEIPYNKRLLSVIVLENMNIYYKNDRINSYLLNYGTNKKISTKIFKDIEKEQQKFTIVKYYKNRQKSKTA